MIIQQDTRQKKQHHVRKEQWFQENGYKIINSKLLVGDYMIPTGSISVDTKKDMSELYSNIIHDHDRIRAEMDLSVELGIQLYVLVENEDGITCIDDVIKWKNPLFFVYKKKQRQGLKARPPVSNQTFLKILHSMERDHGVKFLFCTPNESAKRIVEILTNEVPDNKIREMA